MGSHHLCDTSIPSSQVQESLSPPLWADPEQLLELLRRKHEHRAATQKPEAESTSEEDTLRVERGRDACPRYSPVDGCAGDQGAEDG